MIFPPAVSGAAAAYEIEKSLRFRASASAYLTRTPASASNRRTWSWRTFCKRGILGSNQRLLSVYQVVADPSNDQVFVRFTTGNNLQFYSQNSSTQQFNLVTNAVYRDPSAAMDILVVLDTTNATAADRARIYINGERVTSFSTAVYPALNYESHVNRTSVHHIGRIEITPFEYLDGYLSETHFVDGQALEPSSFGETVGGVWVPKAYSGSYGTNGYYLPFSNGTSLSTLTADASGNGNNWTANNISLTAGVNYDWMDDTPTNNHCVLNSLVSGAANISKANLTSGTTAVRATFNALAIGSYWEVNAGASNVTAGVINDAGTTNTVTVTANKVFAFRLSTAGALDYRNVTDAGSWTSITTGLTGNQFPYGTTAAADWNFGQRPFSGTVPSGYAKLCAANIAAGTITTSGTFTGNASTDGPFMFTNGVPTAMTINGNAVTFGTHADKLANGFKVRSSSASYNAAGSNTYSITTTGAAFKNARAQVNP